MTDVPRLTKTRWPEHITDLLGIPAVQGSAGPWHSTGDTTDLAWFHAICDYLGIEYPGERIRAMKAIIEAAGGTWDQVRHSSAGEGRQDGGNVRREAFEDLWLWLLGADSEPDLVFDAVHESNGGPLPGQRWIVQQILLRRGQQAFRSRLLVAYKSRCAVSGSDLVPTLEAAHIESHAGGGSMETTNGLLLRADLHTLFDLGLIGIDTANWTVIAHRSIKESATGAWIHGRSLVVPQHDSDRPSASALDMHRGVHGL